MDFDQMLEAWRAQNTVPPYDVNRDTLRRALQDEEARIRQELHTRRRGIWFTWIVGTGLAVWAGFWIAIVISNGWPVIYAIAAGASFGLFALGAGALWASRGRESERNFGNTLQEEARRGLALVDHQLSLAERWILPLLGTASIIVGTGLFSWTVNASQDIPDHSSFGGGMLFTALFVGLIVWGSFKERDAMRKAKPKLELRQRHLRALLQTLDAGD
jgi:hypothetical protein